MRPLARRIAAVVNHTDARNGVPFGAGLDLSPRTGSRWSSWVHYGVMVPGLPEPHRWFGVMAILGTSGARCFDRDEAIRTTPRDTAYVVSGSAVSGADAFRSWSMREECELAPDGGRLAFGPAELVLEGLPPHVRVRREGAPRVDLELEVTDRVAWFSHVPGLYDHVSLLARCRGTVGDTRIDALGTWEHAWGAGPYTVARRVVPGWAKAPIRAFTYQVIDLSDADQLLLTVAGSRLGRHFHEGAWERGLEDPGRMHRDVRLVVTADRPVPLPAPGGQAMRMPQKWTWEVRDAAGALRTTLACEARDDWTAGLGAGYVGSFAYAGAHAGRPVEGTGYVEWIEV